jgi:hypothetical protein
MRDENDSTKRLSDLIGGTEILRFQTNRRNFHAILSSLGRCFDGTMDISTSEPGLALLFILLNDGEVTLLDDGPIHYC